MWQCAKHAVKTSAYFVYPKKIWVDVSYVQARPTHHLGAPLLAHETVTDKKHK
jgi:hypothetical protein